jgi:hypothetical protein
MHGVSALKSLLRVAVPVSAAVLLAAGCGGSSSTSTSHTARTLDTVELLDGTTPADSSAGRVANYVPTGKLVADTGFRPAKDGFGFENYGDEVGVLGLSPAYVEDIFGSEVCASGTGATCKLTPPAEEWLQEENAATAAGHCFGMAVAAANFFANHDHPDEFGASKPVSLKITHNTGLQRTIAEYNALQELPVVRSKAISRTPNETLEHIISDLKNGGALPTLGIFRGDGVGGHAVTPYAVEDRGDDRYAVLVYDNNHPGITRAVSFDKQANAWKFVAATNPGDPRQIYSGTAEKSNIALFPTVKLTGHLPCPFCATSPAATKAERAAEYTEISLEGNPDNHAHMLLTDAKGRRTGFVGRRFVHQIPGVQIVRPLNNKDWLETSEPIYRVPTGEPLQITIDGSRLKSPVVERLDVVGPGVDAAVEGIELNRGEKVQVRLSGDDTGLAVQTDSHHGESPLLRLGYAARPTSYDASVKAHKLIGGATLRISVDRVRHELTIDTRRAGANDAYRLRIDSYGPEGGRTRTKTVRLPKGSVTHVHSLAH